MNEKENLFDLIIMIKWFPLLLHTASKENIEKERSNIQEILSKLILYYLAENNKQTSNDKKQSKIWRT